jgi:hypothetical protein
MTEAGESTGSAAEAERKADESGSEKPDVFEVFRTHLREIGEYVAYYLSAKTDQLKVSARTALLYGILAGLGFIVIAGLMIVAGWFIVLGLAGGLAQLFRSAWLGNLVAGLVVLLGSAGAILVGARLFQNQMRDRTIERYENRQRKQQSAYGHSVDTRAEDAGATVE